MTARADTAAQRLALYEGLVQRNRIVSILRIGLPLLGLLVVVLFFLQIFIASLVNPFGIGRVHFAGDTVAVDTPTYSGVMANGDLYTISAEGASTAVTALDVIDITNGSLTLKRTDGEVMMARASRAAFETGGQILTIPGTATVADSDGDSGTLQQVVIDVPRQTLKATGPVHLISKDGSTVQSGGLSFDAKTGIWDFGRATLTVPESEDPAAAQAAPEEATKAAP
jgi:hypothetical protein